MEYFLVRYDSRVVNYDRRGFIRLATDVRNKKKPFLCKRNWPKLATLKSDIFLKAQKVIKYLCLFCKKICSCDLSKKVQSGHTEFIQDDILKKRFSKRKMISVGCSVTRC